MGPTHGLCGGLHDGSMRCKTLPGLLYVPGATGVRARSGPAPPPYRHRAPVRSPQPPCEATPIRATGTVTPIFRTWRRPPFVSTVNWTVYVPGLA